MHAPPPDLQSRLARALTGQYDIERVLGVGGMGTVFLARDITLDRPVAIKVISPDVAGSAELRQRFLLEARTVARLRHPNIVSVYAAGEADGLLWFAMEYVPGESLRDRLQREPVMPAETVMAIVHDLALALDDAHTAGVVHRDVKPENILLDRETGRAMLTDFGVARALSGGDSRLTGVGFVLGSPRYMSPEQAAGEDTIDGRSDLYSLGLVAYEMLAGRPVITAETPATILVKHLTEEPVPLRTLAPDIPDALDTVIARALRKKPEERFPRGRTMAAVLAGLDGDDPAVTSGNRFAPAGLRSGSVRRTAVSARRRRLGIAALAVAVLAAGALFLGGRGSSAPNARSWLIAPFELQTADASLDWLREGAVNMLGLTLSQWNDLSVVDYERTLDLLRDARREDARRVGLEDARHIARRAGAGTVVMGQITTASDSLFVVARRYDVASGRRIDEATAGAPVGSDPRAVFERIARGLLDLAGGPALSMELARQTTASVEAYRLYLDGLRALNRWQLDDADTLFAQALRIDSTFALAYYKRSLGLGWGNITDSVYLRMADRAAEFSPRLPPRQREIILANQELARGFTASAGQDFAKARAHWTRAAVRLAALLAVDSTDAEAWYGLADADFHAALNTDLADPDSLSLLLTRSRRGFERAIALDSSFHLAYQHLVGLYQMSGNANGFMVIAGDSVIRSTTVDSARLARLRTESQQRAREFAAGWLAQEPDGPQAWQSLIDTYAAMQRYDSAIVVLEQAQQRPAAYSPAMAFTLPLYRVLGDQIPEARRDLRAAMARFPADSLDVRSTRPGALLPFVGMTIAGGSGSPRLLDSLVRHAADASAMVPMVNLPTGPTASWFAAGIRLAMGVPATPALLDTLRAGIRRLENPAAPQLSAVRSQSLGVPYAAYFATRDTGFAEVTRRWATESGRQFPELEASLALDRGDTARARELAGTFTDPARIRTLLQSMAGLRVAVQADVRYRLGDLRGAVDTWDAIRPTNFQINIAEPGGALYARSWLARGRVYEELGDTDAAIRAYDQFITWWGEADPSLQEELREAQGAVQRLRDRAPVRSVPSSTPPR